MEFGRKKAKIYFKFEITFRNQVFQRDPYAHNGLIHTDLSTFVLSTPFLNVMLSTEILSQRVHLAAAKAECPTGMENGAFGTTDLPHRPIWYVIVSSVWWWLWLFCLSLSFSWTNGRHDHS